MRSISTYIVLAVALLCLCLHSACTSAPSKLDQYHADKHIRDSIALQDQQRTLTYFQSQLDSLIPVSDSLIALFKYEAKDPKYQDHGYYVATGPGNLRILVREDAQDLLIYRNGKRIDAADVPSASASLLDRAQHLQIVMADVAELELRIHRTNLQIQKYRSRLDRK